MCVRVYVCARACVACVSACVCACVCVRVRVCCAFVCARVRLTHPSARLVRPAVRGSSRAPAYAPRGAARPSQCAHRLNASARGGAALFGLGGGPRGGAPCVSASGRWRGVSLLGHAGVSALLPRAVAGALLLRRGAAALGGGSAARRELYWRCTLPAPMCPAAPRPPTPC